tara:strand:- start:2763 stop:3671 length:909 start_codon:yes stop_codon:yes gene_type:complete
MSSPQKPIILGGHGLGDCMLSLQCASFIRERKPIVLISTRDEVFSPLQHAFGKHFSIKQVDEHYSQDNNILKDKNLVEELRSKYPQSGEEFYYVIPDLLFRNKYAFDYEKYNAHPQVIKSTRLLTQDNKPQKIIYFGTLTTTLGYDYPEAKRLIELIARKFKDYTIYCPSIENWGGDKVKAAISGVDLPDNVFVDVNPKFEDSIDWLKKSCYFVGTCNGPSHLAFHYGIPRLILDPQYERPAWISRWKEDYQESISIETPSELAAKIIELNIEIPQTCLVPRRIVADNFIQDWPQLLLFKEK